MNHNQIMPNKNIFTAYIGLIASGYDLSEGSCDGEILKLIKKTKYDEDIICYFRKARTKSCKVNPYWPRAFLLSLSSIYLTMEPPYEFVDFQKLLNHIESLPQINPSEKDEDLISWLKQFPTIMNKLQSTISIQEIWSKYRLLINSNIENYCWILNQTTLLVTGVLEIAEADLPKLVMIPNYLQAPQATDYVSIEDEIYIIKSRPDQESIIHEILHHCLDIRLEECKDLIKQNISLLKPVLDQMIEYQYAWAYGEGSWSRVFKENLMRAASAWLNFHEDIKSSRKDAQLHKEYGFIYVPVILEQFIFNWKGLDNFRDFIKKCLEACNNK